MASIIILSIVFILIAVRQVGNVKLQIWQIMLGGALAVLFTGQISFTAAFHAVNFDVIIFLFGMFIVGEALEKSGYLSHLTYKFFKNAHNARSLLIYLLFGMGFISIFLMNDTIAIIGTPVVLMIANKNKLPPKLFLLALAFAVTTGSVVSPIGNPQNLLIAINGKLNNSFATFFQYLFIPTLINMFIAFIILNIFYAGKLQIKSLNHVPGKIEDENLARLSRISLSFIIVMVCVKILFIFIDSKFDFRLTYIALAAAIPILIFSPRRIQIIKNIDWHTLIFFAAMFILMQSVWNSGYFQNYISGLHVNSASIFLILAISVLISQLISNVPLVALLLPMLTRSGISSVELMALAAGSTIAGNMLILGAASNVIIIQNAEKKTGETITFWEFARIGVPLTILNVIVYYFYLRYFPF